MKTSSFAIWLLRPCSAGEDAKRVRRHERPGQTDTWKALPLPNAIVIARAAVPKRPILYHVTGLLLNELI